MAHLAKVFCWGMVLSFLGSLPLGTLNVTAAAITREASITSAWIFSLGSMIAELTLVRLGLVAMTKVYRHPKWFRIFQWLTIIVLAALAVGSIVAATKSTGTGYSLPGTTEQPFWLGVLLSGTNPLHYTFWFGWSTILMGKHILRATTSDYNIYVAGIGVGTLAGFAPFIYGEDYIVRRLQSSQWIINWIIGITLGITAIIEVYKALRQPAPKL